MSWPISLSTITDMHFTIRAEKIAARGGSGRMPLRRLPRQIPGISRAALQLPARAAGVSHFSQHHCRQKWPHTDRRLFLSSAQNTTGRPGQPSPPPCAASMTPAFPDIYTHDIDYIFSRCYYRIAATARDGRLYFSSLHAHFHGQYR